MPLPSSAAVRNQGCPKMPLRGSILFSELLAPVESRAIVVSFTVRHLPGPR
jgi:hypothetical protein